MPAAFVPFALLTLSLVALWWRSAAAAGLARHAWQGCLVAAVGAALVLGIVEPLGCLWLGAFALATLGFARTTSQRGRTVSAILIVALAAGLMSHQLPGFNNPRVISDARLSANAVPYRLHLNFDKTCVGLLLLAWCHPLLARREDGRAMLVRTLPIAAGLVGVVCVVALGLGYVRFEPKFPREAWLWLWANLCFTCMAEEAFFRGFVQARLARAWKTVRGGSWLAIAVAAVLFGVAHAAGGLAYVALATVAGVGYGWAYSRAGGRVEASILTHFALNAVHFLGFTYPALQR